VDAWVLWRRNELQRREGGKEGGREVKSAALGASLIEGEKLGMCVCVCVRM